MTGGEYTRRMLYCSLTHALHTPRSLFHGAVAFGSGVCVWAVRSGHCHAIGGGGGVIYGVKGGRDGEQIFAEEAQRTAKLVPQQSRSRGGNLIVVVGAGLTWKGKEEWMVKHGVCV